MQAEDTDMYYLSGVQVYRGMCRPAYMERILCEFAYIHRYMYVGLCMPYILIRFQLHSFQMGSIPVPGGILLDST